MSIFGLWTVLIQHVDVQAIGPGSSLVGLAGINGRFHRFTGVHMLLYSITDWLGIVPVVFAAGFGLLGLRQWITRKCMCKVDRDILLLGLYYIAVMAVYVLFERYPVNYRPVLIDDHLETSYPSSTTLLVLCVMPTAAMQLGFRIINKVFRRFACGAISVFTVFMVLGRLISGVHWLSDIIGAVLFSAGMDVLYYACCSFNPNKIK